MAVDQAVKTEAVLPDTTERVNSRLYSGCSSIMCVSYPGDSSAFN